MRELIVEYQNGNKEVFNEILNQYKNLLYKVINQYGENPMYSKEDKYQVALMSLMKALKTFDANKNIQFSTYLTRIVFNDMNVIFRPCKKRDAIVSSLDDKVSMDSEDLTIEDTLASEDNVEECIIKKCEDEFIKECLEVYKKKYSKKYQAVELILKGYTHREASKHLSYGRTQAGKNYNHFLEFARKRAIEKEIVINN